MSLAHTRRAPHLRASLRNCQRRGKPAAAAPHPCDESRGRADAVGWADMGGTRVPEPRDHEMCGVEFSQSHCSPRERLDAPLHVLRPVELPCDAEQSLCAWIA